MNNTAKQLLAVAKDLISSKIDGPTSLDGMSNQTAKNQVNGLLAKFSKGVFRDDSWRAVNVLWDVLNSAQINWVMMDNKYEHNESGKPSGKRWTFEVYFTNVKGKFTTLHGIIVAAGCGSIEDPLDGYDLVAYVS